MSARAWSGKPLLSSAVVVAAATLVVKFSGAGKELLVAYRLGTSPELGAFLFAYLLPAFLINILSSSLQVALVPRYIKLRMEAGAEAAGAFAARMAGVAALAVTAFVVLLAPVLLVAMPYVAHGFDEQTLGVCRSMLVALMPIVVLGGVASLWSGILNAEGAFAFSALVPLATPVCVAFVLVVAWGALGAYALVVGTLAGACIELLLLGARLRHSGLPLFARARWGGQDQRAVLQQFWPIAGSNVLMAGGALVEQSWAATLSPSSVAAYSFGTRFTTVAAGVLVSTLSTILLPHFSELRAMVSPNRLRRAVLRVASMVLFASVPVALLLAFAAEPLTAALYERGRFTAEDTRIVADVQSVHALYVPVFALGMVAVRLLNAVGASRTLLVGSVISISSSFLLNAALAPTLGVVGIAWANVLMYSMSVGYLWYRTLAFLRDSSGNDS